MSQTWRDFAVFEAFTRELQLAVTKDWTRPVVPATAATVLFRVPYANAGILDIEFLVATRLKGAKAGCKQAHHGGYVDVTDPDIPTAAAREVSEETGYTLTPGQLTFTSLIGPEVYTSTMAMDNGEVVLTILADAAAEPTAPFVLALFCCEVTGVVSRNETDGETSAQGWMSLRAIIEQHGSDTEFIRFQMLFAVISRLAGHQELFPQSSPGTYRIAL